MPQGIFQVSVEVIVMPTGRCRYSQIIIVEADTEKVFAPSVSLLLYGIPVPLDGGRKFGCYRVFIKVKITFYRIRNLFAAAFQVCPPDLDPVLPIPFNKAVVGSQNEYRPYRKSGNRKILSSLEAACHTV